MTAYVRPPIPRQTFVGPDGVEFQYGHRWDVSGPPEDTYSVDSHPERFAPLHAVADALVKHLVATYDVEVDEGDDALGDFSRVLAHRVARAVRLRPASASAAPLTVVWEGYPGVQVHAGALFEHGAPWCGCDACDETAESAAEQLEDLLLAVAENGFEEEVDLVSRWHAVTMTRQGGSSRSGGLVDVTDDRVAAAAARLAGLSGGWRPWPRRG